MPDMQRQNQEPHPGRIGIGIIGGSGAFGRFIHTALADMEGAYLAAIAGRNPERTARAARELQVPGYTDNAALIADPAVAAVVISTPPNQHAEQGIAVARAGKAVFLEKPVATSLTDARALQEAINSNGVACVVDYVMRYNSLFTTLKEWTATRIFGSLRRIDFANYAGDEGLAPDHWFWDRTQSGGILIEHGVHFFDIYGYLAGAPAAQVQGMLTTRRDGGVAGGIQEDKVLATVLYENGVIGTFYHSFDRMARMEHTESLLVYDRAYVTVKGWIALAVHLDAFVDDQGYAALRAVPGLDLTVLQEYPPDQQQARGHGHDMRVTRHVRGVLRHQDDKQDVYRGQVRAALEDLVRAMQDPGYRPRATLADGMTSLDVAVRATQDGRVKQP